MVTDASQGIAVIILTKNERLHIERAIRSVLPFAYTVHVVDSGSHDGTQDLARQLGAEVLEHAWVNYADQFQWAHDNIHTDAGWIMRLDADEYVEPSLASSLSTAMSALPQDVSGITVNRKHVFMGRWIRHGGRYPLTLLRVIRRDKGRIEQRWMDEHLTISEGRAVFFTGDIVDCNLNGLTFFTEKHNGYATREAVDALIERHDLLDLDSISSLGSTAQAVRRRRLKERVYNAMPYQISSLAYFLFRYIVQLGILDGPQGFVYHMLQGYWYRLLAGAKTAEFDNEIAVFATKREKLAALARLSGLKLING